MVMEATVWAKCPNCGKEVSKPDKIFENRIFHVEAYTDEV